MARTISKVEKARKAAGISQQAAAEIISKTFPTYIKKERDPKTLTLDEFGKLYREFGEDERIILDSYLDDIRNA